MEEVYSCAYCLEVIEGYVQREHIISCRRGGTYTVDNIVKACKLCNLSKQSVTPDEWIRYVGRPFREKVDPKVMEHWPRCAVLPLAPAEGSTVRRINGGRCVLAKLPDLPTIEMPGYVAAVAVHSYGGRQRKVRNNIWTIDIPVATRSLDVAYEKAKAIYQHMTGQPTTLHSITPTTLRMIHDPEVLKLYYPEGGFDERISLRLANPDRPVFAAAEG